MCVTATQRLVTSLYSMMKNKNKHRYL